MSSVPKQDVAGRGWQAELHLKFTGRHDRTALVSRWHTGPLLVQRPFYPEGKPCHAYIVHPPGGIVGGDELRLDVEATHDASVVLTTPAATKFYRSDATVARQTQRLKATGSTLEWLPQEAIFFPGAHARSETRIQLDAHSKFIGWEIPCLGLPARRQPFDCGELQLNLELWRDSTPLLIDRMHLRADSTARHAAWGLAGYEAVGTLLAYPANRTALELTRETTCADAQFAATLVDDVLVCRAVAAQAEPIKTLFIGIWKKLRPHLLARPAVLPRIWAT